MTDWETHVQLRMYSNGRAGLYRKTLFQVLNLILRFLKLLPTYIVWWIDYLSNFCFISGQFSFFIPLKYIRKPQVLWYFQEYIKMTWTKNRLKYFLCLSKNIERFSIYLEDDWQIQLILLPKYIKEDNFLFPRWKKSD